MTDPNQEPAPELGVDAAKLIQALLGSFDALLDSVLDPIAREAIQNISRQAGLEGASRDRHDGLLKQFMGLFGAALLRQAVFYLVATGGVSVEFAEARLRALWAACERVRAGSAAQQANAPGGDG